MAIKMYCVFAREALEKFKGSQGRLAAQAGHAYLHAFFDADKKTDYFSDHYDDDVYNYRYGNNAIKIALVVEDCVDLEHLYELYKDKCGVSLVEENSYTPEPLITCLGIGPIRDEDREEILPRLQLLNREL